MNAFRVVAVGSLCVLAGCASRSEPYYVRVAEALTSPTVNEGLTAAYRMFSASQLVEACKIPRVVRRLETDTPTLELQVGERLGLNTLRVVAINEANAAMAPFPIAIEALDMVPPVLQLRSDDPDLIAGRLYPLNIGTFRLRIRTLCGTPGSVLMIDGRVLP